MRMSFVFTDKLARDRISLAATRYNLDPVLVAAIIMQESGGCPDAFRMEPEWKWFWDVKLKTPFRQLYPNEILTDKAPADFHSLVGEPDQEWLAQKCSWGSMQLMGAAARELGYSAPYLTGLCDPFDGLQWGCKKLAQCINSHGTAGISAYNSGVPDPGSPYEKSVLGWIEKLRPLFV